jgi:uncharacterized membrane protein
MTTIAERVDRVAVLTAMSLLAAGLALFVLTGAGADALLTAGLIALMATPGLRLLATLIVEWERRDWLALASTLAVALVLVWSFALALAD